MQAGPSAGHPPRLTTEETLTPQPSELVAPPRVAECPVQLECRLTGQLPLAANDPERADKLLALEVAVLRVHLDEAILRPGTTDRVDLGLAEWRA